MGAEPFNLNTDFPMVTEPFPFIEDGDVRIFKSGIDQSELKWHWDHQDRLIKSLHITNWEFQLDNELPKLIPCEVPIRISAGLYHRLIGGDDDLILHVQKL